MNWYKKATICDKYDCDDPAIQKLFKSLGFDTKGNLIIFPADKSPEAEEKRKKWKEEEYDHGPA